MLTYDNRHINSLLMTNLDIKACFAAQCITATLIWWIYRVLTLASKERSVVQPAARIHVKNAYLISEPQ